MECPVFLPCYCSWLCSLCASPFLWGELFADTAATAQHGDVVCGVRTAQSMIRNCRVFWTSRVEFISSKGGSERFF
ncbi:hypothetical protein Y032_0014g2381 [Ancylostoma ceylanicum]|nr:hypothetical protein Y032_0014g2381 [Ancylostoma ceylanicum]